MQIQRVGVIGAGTMGNGIAHVFARGGYSASCCAMWSSGFWIAGWRRSEES